MDEEEEAWYLWAGSVMCWRRMEKQLGRNLRHVDNAAQGQVDVGNVEDVGQAQDDGAG